MLITIKMIALLFTLGIDNLLMSTTVALINPKGKVKIAITFACAEALMPLIGLAVGNVAGLYLGYWATLVGGILLLGLGGWLFFFDDDDDEKELLKKRFVGWSLFFTAISISLDELAVGFSIGLIGVPVLLTVILIAVSAIVVTTIGITFGAKLKHYLGEWAERVGAVILAILGLWMLIESIVNI
jgi:manganese efflux pump family protein